MDLYLDIETIPSQKEGVKEAIAEGITAPGNYTKPESIAKWEEEHKPGIVDAAWRKTSFDGTLGEIICISYAIDDGEPDSVYRSLDRGEGQLLRDFFASLTADLKDDNGQMRYPVWIGHYLTVFDLRFIWHRCVINGVRPTVKIPYDAKPWDSNIFDTCIEWKGGGKHHSGSMEDICLAMDIEGKGDMHGSKVWDAVKAGEIQKVVEYCEDDVRRTRAMHKRMTFRG